MIYQAVAKMPAGAVGEQVQGLPQGRVLWRAWSSPAGEVIYYLKGNGTKHLERFRVRTPTFANIPALVSMLKGAVRLADVGNILLTIDPCISPARERWTWAFGTFQFPKAALTSLFKKPATTTWPATPYAPIPGTRGSLQFKRPSPATTAASALT